MERHKCKFCFKRFPNGRALGGHMRSHIMNRPSKEPDYSFSSEPEVIVQDVESETESSKNPNGKRSIRVSKYRSWEERESSRMAEEDVAYCLMMLSRDKSQETYKHGRIRGKYKCETCNKVFRSYQALGGHRASHKKIKVVAPRQEKEIELPKIHQCPICLRVFGSGQALGGHKRSHVSASYAKSLNNFGENWIDLNLPAPIDDDHDDDEISQFEVSAVSDAELFY